MMQEIKSEMEERYNTLLKRIVEGAYKIDELEPDDPNYKKYMKLYDQLCTDLRELRQILNEQDAA